MPFKTTMTDSDGKYIFEGLCAGVYTVSFHTPGGYTHTLPNQACNVNGQPADETDSDCDCTGAGVCGVCVTLPANTSENLTIDCGYIPECALSVTKGCSVPPPPPSFDCSGAKPILSFKVRWNGATSPIWVKAWNGSIAGKGVAMTTFGPVNSGDVVTFTRSSSSTPNDVYFEIFSCAAMTSACKLGNSTFHLSCSDSDMNGPEDCGKPEGDGKGGSGYINTWAFEGMAGASQGFECTTMPPPPSSNCSVPEMAMPNCDTVGKPTSLTFRYTGGGCAASNNPQSGKFTCSGSVNSALPISVANSNGYTISPTMVAPGGEFTVSAGSFKAQSGFTLTNAGGTETLSIHTSCSQTLEVGNVFGDLTLVGFNGQTGGSAIDYDYAVTNNGPFILNNVYLTDNRLGPLAGPFTLQPFETRMFSAQAQINGTTDNVATVYIDNGQGPTCQMMSNQVTVNVIANCPVWANAATFSSKQLKRSISNTGSTKVTLTGLMLSWPASNGKLVKIKFDGDTVWDKQSAPGATSITIDSASLTSDPKKKSIDPGATRVFILEFQNNASTSLNQYSGSLSFGSCTLGF